MKNTTKHNFIDSGIKSHIFLPLLIWFIISLLHILKTENSFLTLFFSPINVIFGILFFTFIIYHLHCEIIYIINNHINKIKYKKNIVSFVHFITYITIFFVVLSILKIHFNSIFQI